MSEQRFFRFVPRTRPRPTRADFSSPVDSAGNEWPDAEWHEVEAWTWDIAGADDPCWLAADFRERRRQVTACPCGGDRIGGSGCTCPPPF